MPLAKLCPGCTVSRLVPSAAISACSRGRRGGWDRPSTATMAATPIAMPSADSAARSFRVRSPTQGQPGQVGDPEPGGGRGAGGRARQSGRLRRGGVRDDPAVEHLVCCRRIRAATASSWVTTTIVVPAAWSSSSRSRMAAPVAESRLPVGSSASTIAGAPASARAIATRCRSPPDSWVGRARRLWPSPTRSSAAAAPAARAADPGIQQPVGHVAQPGGVLGQEELLEHEPDPVARSPASPGRRARPRPGR